MAVPAVPIAEPALQLLPWVSRQRCHSCLQVPEAAMGMNGLLVLAADQPAALACLYGELLGVEPQSGLSASHWRLPWPAGGWLEVYGPSRSRRQP